MADGRAFVDTNVLLYAHDASEAQKQPIARRVLQDLWASRSGSLSSQVLQEFYAVATTKLVVPLSRDEAREVLRAYSAWHVVTLDATTIMAATWIQERYQVSFWDALILEAACIAGADRLLTEDLQDGQVIEGVRIVNPFLDVSGSRA